MNDLISRQSAIDEANAWLLDCFNVPKQNRSCGLIRRLEDLPSAQPERKKGKWIKYRYCSCCEWDKKDFDIYSGWAENYCPNCGADMRGEQDE